MNALAMAFGGGFCGMTCAAAIAFYMGRRWIRAKFVEWLGDAHRSGVCPLCKQPMKHEGPPPDDVVG